MDEDLAVANREQLEGHLNRRDCVVVLAWALQRAKNDGVVEKLLARILELAHRDFSLSGDVSSLEDRQREHRSRQAILVQRKRESLLKHVRMELAVSVVDEANRPSCSDLVLVALTAECEHENGVGGKAAHVDKASIEDDGIFGRDWRAVIVQRLGRRHHRGIEIFRAHPRRRVAHPGVNLLVVCSAVERRLPLLVEPCLALGLLGSLLGGMNEGLLGLGLARLCLYAWARDSKER